MLSERSYVNADTVRFMIYLFFIFFCEAYLIIKH